MVDPAPITIRREIWRNCGAEPYRKQFGAGRLGPGTDSEDLEAGTAIDARNALRTFLENWLPSE